MVDCDMCGKKNISPTKTKIEGTIMTTCSDCSKYGETLIDPTKRVNNFTTSRPRTQRVDPEANKFVVRDYSVLVKQARELKGLKQEQVAKALNEKESIIHKVESGTFKPSFRLAQKLENFFSIKLIEEVKESVPMQNFDEQVSSPLTMEEAMLAALKKAKK
jgi:putative transcription factor